MKILIFILVTLFAIWIIGTLIVVWGIESPKYIVLEKKRGYELRKYDSYIVAEVEVSGDYSQSMNSGFRILANYIFGGNTKNESIKMTTPVSEVSGKSEKISMTTPVNEIQGEGSKVVQFSMPKKYDLQTLPIPYSKNIQLKEIQSYTAAVLKYTGYATESRVNHKKAVLIDRLQKDTISILGAPVSAQYNPPLSFPLLRRNEIIIPIEY